MEFETIFFNSMNMSSDELFAELMDRLPSTKPISWPGLIWEFIQHPRSIDELVLSEMGEEFEEKHRKIKQQIRQNQHFYNQSLFEGQFDECRNFQTKGEDLHSQLTELESSADGVRDKWNSEIKAQVKFRKAWSDYVYSVLHPQNALKEKKLILGLSKELVLKSRETGRRITQADAKRIIKEAKSNGFHTPFAWSICYANARLIYDGVR